LIRTSEKGKGREKGYERGRGKVKEKEKDGKDHTYPPLIMCVMTYEI
jgi:hypothetical protein